MPVIIPDGTPDYNSKIRSFEQLFRKNPVGALVIGALQKDVTVKPIHYFYDERKEEFEKNTSCRAVAAAHDIDAASLPLKKPGDSGYDSRRDQFYKGVLINEDAMSDRRSETFDKRIPTGLGSKTTIYFSSGLSTACTGTGWNDPELILFHELVHGLRHSQGLSRTIPTRKSDWSNEEEFLAVVVANVYASARDKEKAALRHGHGDNALWPGINDSAGFVDQCDHFDVLKYHTTWNIFVELAKMKDIIFNPFYEFDRRSKLKKQKACVRSF
jgi:hypothetical protein